MVSKESETSVQASVPAPAELLTAHEYAKAAKVSVSWLAKARKRGDGPPFVRFGRSVRYYPLSTLAQMIIEPVTASRTSTV